MAVNFSSSYSRTLGDYYHLKYQPGAVWSQLNPYDSARTMSRGVYTPSFTGWMFMNYTVLALLMSLPFLIANAVGVNF